VQQTPSASDSDAQPTTTRSARRRASIGRPLEMAIGRIEMKRGRRDRRRESLPPPSNSGARPAARWSSSAAFTGRRRSYVAHVSLVMPARVRDRPQLGRVVGELWL
jgi:hypothetical protein